MAPRIPPYPIVDVWANLLGLGAAIPEVARLFVYSHSDPEIANKKRSPEEVIALMDEAGVSHICLSAWSRPGQMIFSNEEVARYTRAYPSRIFGLAAVNLHNPVEAVKELGHYFRNEGFVGLRVVPWLWNLAPIHPHYWPLFVKCIELDIPFLTQVGHTAPACPSEVGRPIPHIDTITLKFPDLKIIMGHIGYPWAAETTVVAWKHKNAVKLEGGAVMASTIQLITRAGIPVMAHIGLTPQRHHSLGGVKVQAKSATGAVSLLQDAITVQKAGAFMILIEAVPAEVAALVTKCLRVPTIGIGSGDGCSGQVLVQIDTTGNFPPGRFTPKFLKVCADVWRGSLRGIRAYKQDVKSRAFASPDHAYPISDRELEEFQRLVDGNAMEEGTN